VDLNRLTQKSQEALHDAQTKALRFGHTEIDVEHLLLAVIEQPEGLVPRLLSATGVDPDKLREQVEAELNRRPRVSGPGAAPGQVFVTSACPGCSMPPSARRNGSRTSTSPSSTW